MGTEIIRLADAKAVATAAADAALKLIATLQQTQDEVHLMVTGGSVGIATLAEMRALETKYSVDFKRINWWWGDERFVASNSSDRNELQAREALLNHLDIDESKVHAFPAADNGLTLDDAVGVFDSQIAAITGSAKTLPRFDIVFLGMGPDGHIASLFPGKPEIAEGVLTLAEHDSPKPPPARLTFSFEALNSADRIWFTLAGADKAEAAASAFSSEPERLPVGRVHGKIETVWFIDEAAANGIAN